MIQDEAEIDQHRRKGSNGGSPATQQPIFSKFRSLSSFSHSFGSLFSGSSSIHASCEDSDGTKSSLSVECDAGFDSELDNMAEQSIAESAPTHQTLDLESVVTPYAPHSIQSDSYWSHQSKALHCDTKGFAVGIPSGNKKSPRVAHISTFLPETRRFFGKLSRSRRDFDRHNCYDSDFTSDSCTELALGSASMASTAVFPSVSSLDISFVSSPSESCFANHTHGHLGYPETPPLTPDLSNNRVLTSRVPFGSLLLEPSLSLGSSRFSSQFALSDTLEEARDESANDAIYSSPYLREIKEGKKPERISDVDLYADCDHGSNALECTENPDEWYGLEYTLEMSSRDKQPADSQSRSFSGGEHSRSRESWAAIHRGTIHPFFEDEDYLQWKNWHRLLDRQAEKKKHRKGYEFKSRSKQLAWLYVDEVRTRDVLYWQKEVFGVVARDVKERLQYIVERRPDPFSPPQKHDWSWYLKRSRSVACLRELKIC